MPAIADVACMGITPFLFGHPNYTTADCAGTYLDRRFEGVDPANCFVTLLLLALVNDFERPAPLKAGFVQTTLEGEVDQVRRILHWMERHPVPWWLPVVISTAAIVVSAITLIGEM